MMLGFWMYRLRTILRSLRVLYSLPPDKVEAFVRSYEIYNHDWVNEEELVRSMGKEYYAEIKKKLVDWYSVLNHLCAIGQVEKMYIPPAMDLSKGIIANQNLYEEKMCRDLDLKPGAKVLDIGCGRGRVASHVASYTGANVMGINIDPDQLASAEWFATYKNLPCQFRLSDLNELPLPFADGSLDAIYHVQVFSLAKDLQKLCCDLHRMLKPGGKFACLDWVRLNYDANNPEHVELMKRVKPLIGAIGTPSPKEYTDALERAGFRVTVSENVSVGGLQAPLIENADRFFTRVTKLIYFLVRWKVIPAHFKALFDRFVQDGQAFVEADRKGLLTTSYYIVAEKV
jgi:sterol 24-C-methyltransferase